MSRLVWRKRILQQHLTNRDHMSCISFYFLKILFIYLTDRDHKQAERQAEREGEAGSLLSREPDVGLDPRTLRP